MPTNPVDPAEQATAPTPPLPLVGRNQELERILDRLTDDRVRLMTISGPGGIGKTRLARAILAQAPGRVQDELAFAPVRGVRSRSQFAATIADAVGVSHARSGSSWTDLTTGLADRELLLVLDDFDAVLDELGAGIAGELLEAAPALKLLITSRARLGLQQEYVFPLNGLATPEAESPHDPRSYPALELFTLRAEQVDPSFELDQHMADVTTICRLVEGHPLAIELAAPGVRALTPVQIAEEIRSGLAFLKHDFSDLPKRHRSLMATVERSWDRLPANLRPIFLRLTVFEGPFDRQQAETVCGGDLPELAALIDRSLLQRREAGGYRMHNLLRRFGRQQLQDESELLGELRRRHWNYHLNLVANAKNGLDGQNQAEALAAIRSVLDDVRTAWQRAVQAEALAAIVPGLNPLMQFHQMTGRFGEGADQLRHLLAHIPDDPGNHLERRAVAEATTEQGWFAIRTGEFELAERLLQRSLSVYEEASLLPPSGLGSDPRTGLAILANARGHFKQAANYGTQALADNQARGDDLNCTVAHYALAGAATGRGLLEEARRHAQASADLCQALGHDWFLSYSLNELGKVSRLSGELDAAREYFQRSYELRRQFADPEGMAIAKHHLGWVSLEAAQPKQAMVEFEQAQKQYRKLDDRGGLTSTLHGIGLASLRLEHRQSGLATLARALTIASDMNYRPELLSQLVTVVAHMPSPQLDALRLQALHLARDHPGADYETRQRAERALERLEASAKVSPAEPTPTLSPIVTRVLAWLNGDSNPGKTSALTSSSQDQDHPGPLTERELQVLTLMAQGLTNPQIAEVLVLAVGTVKWYSSQIYRKLDAANRSQAVALAHELDLLH